MGDHSITDDEIIALTLKNSRVVADLRKLLDAGELHAKIVGFLIDHERALPQAYAKLRPMEPLVLPFNYRKWLRALRHLYTNINIVEDLDSVLQGMSSIGHSKEPLVVSARADWEHLCALQKALPKDSGAIEAYIRAKFDGWPEPVKEGICLRAPLNERLAALTKCEAFEAELRAAACGLDTGIPR